MAEPSWAGWVKKKPSPQFSKPWKSARLQKRWLITRGNVVDYYDNQPKTSRDKPKGSFDLRVVEKLRPAKESDPTAPDSAVLIVVAKHQIVIDFMFCDERDGCLRIWANAAPPASMPSGWKTAQSPEMRQQLHALSGDQPEQAAALDDEAEEVGGDDFDEAAGRAAGTKQAALGPETVVKEGWLHKQGKMSWKRRYFRLTTRGLLKYYEDSRSAALLPSRVLEMFP